MSSNRRLAILWNAATGATGSGIRMVLISSSGRLTVRRYPVKYSDSGTVRSPLVDASTSEASSASSAGGLSPIGEPVPRLPPRVAPLRISREANCGKHLGQQRHPAGQAAFDLGQGQRGADVDVVVADRPGCRGRGAVDARWSGPSRECRMFSSTPQSVDPASSRASGYSANRVTASARSVGRRYVGPAGGDHGRGRAGAGWERRCASASDSGGAPSA